MESFTLPILLRWLDGAAVRLHEGFPFPACTGGIRLLEPPEEPLRPGFLYLGSPEQVSQALALGAVPKEGAAVVSCAGGPPG